MSKKKCKKCCKFYFIEDLNEVFYNEKKYYLICDRCLEKTQIFYCDSCKKLFIYSEVFSEYIENKEFCQSCLERNKTELGKCNLCHRLVYNTNGFIEKYGDNSFIYHDRCYIKEFKDKEVI